MRRTPWVLVAVISAASLLLSGCGDARDPAAAKIGSTTISRTTLDDELRTITENQAWAKSVSQSLQFDLTPTNGGVATGLSSRWLTTLVNYAVADRVFEQRNLTVTAKNRADAKAAAIGIFVDQATFNKLPPAYRETVLARQARFEAVRASIPPAPGPTEAELRRSLEQTRATLCPSGTSVAQIQTPTKEAADAIRAELAQGADFATLARERSADTDSGASGGLVACTDSENFNQLPEAFRNAATPLPVGGVSQPVQTEFGWHVIKIGIWDLATARPILVRVYEADQIDPMTLFINDQLLKQKVWVDPRYGAVRRSKDTVVITPPSALELKTDPAEPTTTTASGATGQ